MENNNPLESLHILVEQSAVRDMYVDPNRPVLTLTYLTLLIFIINVFLPGRKNSFENGGVSSGNYRNPELKQRRSGVSTIPARRF